MSDILRVEDLRVTYSTQRGDVHAVDGVHLSVRKGEIFGLAGESGCGKSTTAYSICRLLRPSAKITKGRIEFNGIEITSLSEAEFDNLRWSSISIILQSAMNNLNPVMKIRPQLTDAISAHEHVSKAQLNERAEQLFSMVGLPTERLDSYPHELSGGMKQRVVIAMAMALKPDLVILDEPTTALDVITQHAILQRIVRLQRQFQFSLLFITHDLPLMLEICDRVGVMYAGKMVEVMDRKDMLQGPRHPYTVGLLNSFPSLFGERGRLGGVPGTPPNLLSPPPGCRFHPRCDKAMARCRVNEPQSIVDQMGMVSCHLYEEAESREPAATAGPKS